MSEEEFKVRWAKIADDHWKAKHADWHLRKVKSYRGHEWELFWGDPREPDHPGAVGRRHTKKAINAYLERRAPSDIEHAKQAAARKQAAEAGTLLLPRTERSEVVEIQGIDRRIMHLELTEHVDEVHRRCWVVYVGGSLLHITSRRWRLGVIVEGLGEFWLRDASLLPQGGETESGRHPIDESVPWDYAWHRFGYQASGWRLSNHGRDDYAQRLAFFVLSRGAHLMAQDCIDRELYTEGQRKEIDARRKEASNE